MSKELLEAEKALADKKAKHIKALLDERVSLQLQTEERLKAIAEELKSLGWKAQRTKREKGIADASGSSAGAGTEAGMLNDQQDGPYDIRS